MKYQFELDVNSTSSNHLNIWERIKIWRLSAFVEHKQPIGVDKELADMHLVTLKLL